MKTKNVVFGIFLALLVARCTKEDATKLDVNSAITQDETVSDLRVDTASDDISAIIEDQLDPSSSKTNGTAGAFVPICAKIAVSPAKIAVGTTITKTVDFGTTGCTLPNGNVIKGKVIFSHVYDPSVANKTITYELVDFSHNDIKLSGKESLTLTFTTATPASPSHPLVFIKLNLTATFTNGKTITRIGNRTREMIEGYSTPADRKDDVYKISGDWVTTFSDQKTQNVVITTPLIFRVTCPNLTKGIITITRGSRKAILDFGNDTCTNKATLTIEGISIEIMLGK